MAGMLFTQRRAMLQSLWFIVLPLVLPTVHMLAVKQFHLSICLLPTIHMLVAYKPLRLLVAAEASPRAVLEGIQPIWLACFTPKEVFLLCLRCLAYVFLAPECVLLLLKCLLQCPPLKCPLQLC
ncbi:hypothetical protein U1Q18_047107 [Sarracenia purpurea var. burkii]